MLTFVIKCCKLILLTTFLIYQFENCVTGSNGISIPKKIKRGCKAPELTLNGVPVLARQGATPNYETLTEIRFAAHFPNLAVKQAARDCKIKCIDGEWIGPLCQNTENGRYRPVLHNCEISLKNDSSYDLTINDVPLHSYEGSCLDHTVVKIKCKGNPGYYKQRGSMYTVCIDGSWTDEITTCIPTTLMTNYSELSPPTISYELTAGSMVIDDNNRLVLFPGSTLHLDCHYKRDNTTPSWHWTNRATSYIIGWNEDSVYNQSWKYRLSIKYINPEDSGEFECTTPGQLTNSVKIRVIEVYCKDVNGSADKYLTVKMYGNKLGQEVKYSCDEGYELNGLSTAICLESGEWSEEIPRCKPITCSDVYFTEPQLVMESYSTLFEGVIEFNCQFGYKLIGAEKIRCDANGQWSDKIPSCKEIICATPIIPANGNLIEQTGNGKYMYGTILQFACNSNYQLNGVETITCNDDGTWSDRTPICEPRCQYPGEPEHGRMFPLEFYYNTGEKITVKCDPGYISLGSQNITCSENGQWSHPLPKCIFYSEM